MENDNVSYRVACRLNEDDNDSKVIADAFNMVMQF